ncbi:hypothetical protein NONI108955_25900 [Nocardia ninae]|uniref:Uncharacterized protein n=1 Tax=Nocardia ninae NBRC 108245 TaxID=1210091 RepID=A0A511MIF0_9NOCA|nr:hypothetical protein [Nocardia ninae]GEM40434.1 hypothetical protein NN4_49530 [Nocardia ninae NBRC 108245]
MSFVIAGVVLIAAAALVDFSWVAAGICFLVAVALVVVGVIGVIRRRNRGDEPGAGDRTVGRRSGGTGASSSEFHAGGGGSE